MVFIRIKMRANQIDEGRMFYVALTKSAGSMLYLSFSKKHPMKKVYAASPYLNMAGLEPVSLGFDKEIDAGVRQDRIKAEQIRQEQIKERIKEEKIIVAKEAIVPQEKVMVEKEIVIAKKEIIVKEEVVAKEKVIAKEGAATGKETIIAKEKVVAEKETPPVKSTNIFGLIKDENTGGVIEEVNAPVVKKEKVRFKRSCT